jgi:Tol biopolymer transport system component
VSRPRWWPVAAAAISVVVVGLIGAASWPYLGRPEPFASIAMRRLTNTGNVADAAISPDGRYVVQLVDPLDAPSIWIRQVSSTSNMQIVPPMQGAVGGLAFTPDGESVLYLLYPPKGSGSLFKVPLFGGPKSRLVDGLDTVPAFSPDGTRMAFVQRQSSGEMAIVLASADGTNQHRLAARQSPSDFQNKRLAWSPAGNQIAAFAGMMPRQRSRIVLVDVNTGKDRDLTEPRFDFPGQLAWLPDGRALVFNAVEWANGRVGSTGQLWIASYPEGVVRRITSDIANYSTLAATRDGATLAAVQGDERAGLWVAANGDVARARSITPMSAGRDGWSGFDWTSDGRVVYTSMMQGTWDLWVTDVNGGKTHQLTSVAGVETNPRIMPDGKTVVYVARPAGDTRFHIHTIDVDGTNARELPLDGAQPGLVQVAAGSVYFVRLVNGVSSLHRAPLAGGASEMAFRDPANLPRSFVVRLLSEDGKWAVGTVIEPNAPLQFMLVPLDQSQPPRMLPFPLRPAPEFKFAWSPARDAFDVLALRDGVANVWRFPLDGREPSRVTAFTTTSEILTGFAWSRDGMLAVSRATQSSDVVLISNRR